MDGNCENRILTQRICARVVVVVVETQSAQVLPTLTLPTKKLQQQQEV
jgi:hypothetical protein